MRSHQRSYVSISRSRCFSFQLAPWTVTIILPSLRFQSRDRDAFLFNFVRFYVTERPYWLFQSRDRDAFLFNVIHSFEYPLFGRVSISRSRCFSFQLACFRCGCQLHVWYVSISRSRCFSFQLSYPMRPTTSKCCFNLAIEMLFFSTNVGGLVQNAVGATLFQSRDRDAFLFNSHKPRFAG